MATEENTIGFEVEKSVIDDFVSGKQNTFSVDINEDSKLYIQAESSLLLRRQAR